MSLFSYSGARAFIVAALSGLEARNKRIAESNSHFASDGREFAKSGPGTAKVRRLAKKARGVLRNRLAHRGRA